ncbi:MAG TPA: hypothetical protein PLX89_16320 [Verrucomicrobiota bacterium]|nr:hypothetical protein [Verrucomicrobiales bacterium]HRI14563.1 hypothetical protein [Verrucomicrobiota bacterium]
MNFDELQQVWNSPRNHLPMAQQRALVETFSRQMIRRRRFQTFWLIHTFVGLTLITGLASVMIATGKTSSAQEWGLIPLLLVPWAFAVHLLRRYRQPAAPTARGELPVSESLSLALESNQTAQSQSKWVGALYLVMTPLLGLAMQQLHAAGKVSSRELVSMAVFFGATLLFCGAIIAARHFGRLRPQQKQLEGLLQQFKQGTGQ